MGAQVIEVASTGSWCRCMGFEKDYDLQVKKKEAEKVKKYSLE